jgi:hypothetical protein
MIDDAGRAVLAAEEAVDAVCPRIFQEMKALHRPPRGIAQTALAAKVLLDIEKAKAGADAEGVTFGSSETIALVCWRDHQMRQRLDRLVYDNPIPSERLARLLEMETDEAFTPEAVTKQNHAAAAICGLIRAVVRFYACSAKAEASQTLRAWKQSWQAREHE